MRANYIISKDRRRNRLRNMGSYRNCYRNYCGHVTVFRRRRFHQDCELVFYYYGRRRFESERRSLAQERDMGTMQLYLLALPAWLQQWAGLGGLSARSSTYHFYRSISFIFTQRLCLGIF
jgi:hypothetical protein